VEPDEEPRDHLVQHGQVHLLIDGVIHELERFAVREARGASRGI
jgi:hypothetical protein